MLLFRLSRIAATAKDLVLDQMTNKTSLPLFFGFGVNLSKVELVKLLFIRLVFAFISSGLKSFELFESLHCYTMSKFTIV